MTEPSLPQPNNNGDLFPSGHLNDLYNARVFKKMFENEILWNKNAGGWFIYDEYWQLDTNDRIKQYCIKLFDEMRDYTSKWKKTKTEEEDNIKDYWVRHVKNSGQNAKMEAMLDCSKALMNFSGDFDNNHWYLNCKNGTVNLKTGDLYKHDPLDYISKICNVNYNKDAQCPIWLSFLNDIFEGNKDIIDYMQKVIGYSLTGITTEQCFFILWGSGCNGKSTCIETISSMLGDYSLTCDSSTLMLKDKNQINNDVARLRGSRFVSAAESNRHKEFDEMVIKRLTGNDKITARFLNKENFEFYPTFKIFMTTNHKPNIRSIDEGIWRRVKMIPFLFKINESIMDRFLGDKLKEEMSGILNWAIEGCLRWQKEGLKIPEIISTAISNYKKEEDRIGQFLEDECILGENLILPAPILREKLWDELGFKISNKNIGEYMRVKGYEVARAYRDGKQMRVYKGIGFKSDYPNADIDREPQPIMQVQTTMQAQTTIVKEEMQIDWEN